MTPFESYAREVALRSPWRQREEVAQQILEDLHAELTASDVQHPDTDRETLMLNILRRRDPPMAVADSFERKPPMLIGPSIYPAYRLALITAAATSFVAIVATTLAWNGSSATAMLSLLADLALSAAIIFAAVTLTFAVVERLGLATTVPPTWHRLEPKPHQPPAAASRSIGSIGFALVVLVAIHFFPLQVGPPILITEPHWHIQVLPVLAPGFSGWPRALVTIWGLTTIIAGCLERFSLRTGARLQFVCTGFGIATTAMILLCGDLLAVPAKSAFRNMPEDLSSALFSTVAPPLVSLLLVCIWIGVLVRAIYLVRDLRRIRRA